MFFPPKGLFDYKSATPRISSPLFAKRKWLAYTKVGRWIKYLEGLIANWRFTIEVSCSDIITSLGVLVCKTG